MKTKQAGAGIVAQNQAILFAPLRVIADGRGGWDVCTREDNNPGSRNNFVLASCQHRAEARLFAAAPELMGALRELTAFVYQHVPGWVGVSSLGPGMPIYAKLEAARAALDKAEAK